MLFFAWSLSVDSRCIHDSSAIYSGRTHLLGLSTLWACFFSLHINNFHHYSISFPLFFERATFVYFFYRLILLSVSVCLYDIRFLWLKSRFFFQKLAVYAKKSNYSYFIHSFVLFRLFCHLFTPSPFVCWLRKSSPLLELMNYIYPTLIFQ